VHVKFNATTGELHFAICNDEHSVPNYHLGFTDIHCPCSLCILLYYPGGSVEILPNTTEHSSLNLNSK